MVRAEGKGRADDRDRRRDGDDHAEDHVPFLLRALLCALRAELFGAVIGVAPLGLAAGIARRARSGDAAALVRGLLLELVKDLLDGIGLVRPAVTHGAAAVGLVFIDDEVAVAVAVDTEGLCPRVVEPDEKAHLGQRQLVPVAEGLELGDRARRGDAAALIGRLRGFGGGTALGDGRAAVLAEKAAVTERGAAGFTITCHKSHPPGNVFSVTL